MISLSSALSSGTGAVIVGMTTEGLLVGDTTGTSDAMTAVLMSENADKKRESRKKRLELSLSERIARVEETLEKIQNRISRRQKIVSDIENKYQRQGVELPENIQYQ